MELVVGLVWWICEEKLSLPKIDILRKLPYLLVPSEAKNMATGPFPLIQYATLPAKAG